MEALTAAGWKPLVVWECDTADEKALSQRVKRFLGGALR
jgi:G:T-mismatch repair DNA endonuclease (very short patch repair protein)